MDQFLLFSFPIPKLLIMILIDEFKIVYECDFDGLFLITFLIDEKSLILIEILGWVIE